MCVSLADAHIKVKKRPNKDASFFLLTLPYLNTPVKSLSSALQYPLPVQAHMKKIVREIKMVLVSEHNP
jgi:hypothetical protein